MNYNFDEIIDRRHTNSENVEGFREYMFAHNPDIELPVPDDELIRMWVADMEFAVAPEICDAISKRVEQRIFGYTQIFESSYYDAFLKWCKDRYDWSFDREEVVNMPGIIPALYEIIGDLTDEDEKVLFTSPSYGFFKHAARFNKREFVTSPLAYNDGRFTIDFDDFAKKAADPKVKLVIWCNPHNPTGRVWTEDEARKIAEIVEENDLWIISDEIHCDLLRNGQMHIPMGKIMPEYNKLITCMAASKTFNMAGFMFSNIIVRDAGLRKTMRKHSTNGGMINPVSLAANQAAYESGWPWLQALRDYLDDNFKFVEEFVAEQLPGAVYKGSEATYLAWVNLNGCFEDINEKRRTEILDDLPGFFAKNAGVLVEGGDRLFVDNAKGFIRLNLAMPRATIKEGMTRIAKAIERIEQ